MHFLHIDSLFFSGRGHFLALLAAGHAGGPRVHYGARLGPAGLRGACSGHSKSRELGHFHGIAFRRGRAKQVHENPEVSFIAIHFFTIVRSAAVPEVPQQPSKVTHPRYNRSKLRTVLSACVRELACVCVYISSTDPTAVGTKNSLKKRGAMIFFTVLCSLLLMCTCITRVSFRRCGSHGATSAVLQGLLFCDSYTRMGFLRVRACACHPERKLDDCNPHFL